MSYTWRPDSEALSVNHELQVNASQVGMVHLSRHLMPEFPDYQVEGYFWITQKEHSDGEVRYSTNQLLQLHRVDECGDAVVLDSDTWVVGLRDYESPLDAARMRGEALEYYRTHTFYARDFWHPSDYEDKE